MRRTSPLTAAPHWRSDPRNGVWWCVRWVLVLALIFDLLSAPLHRHHHEGVSGPLDFISASASSEGAQSYADNHERSPFVHAATAIRVDLSSLGKLPAADDVAWLPAVLSLMQLLAAVDEAPPRSWWPAPSRPDFRSHSSLPPAGRAPPLHA